MTFMTFASDTGEALPLHLATSENAKDVIAALDLGHRAWAEATEFKGKAGEVVLLPGADGTVVAALGGLGGTRARARGRFLADRIVVLRGGHIEQVGKPLDLYNNPANKFVAGFIGAPQMNFLAGKLAGTALTLDCGISRDLPTSHDKTEAVTLGIRPEAIGVSLESDGDAEIEVRNFEQLGAVTYIYAAFPNGEPLTVQLARQVPLTRGQKIGVTLPTESFHIFGEDERALPLGHA